MKGMSEYLCALPSLQELYGVRSDLFQINDSVASDIAARKDAARLQARSTESTGTGIRKFQDSTAAVRSTTLTVKQL